MWKANRGEYCCVDFKQLFHFLPENKRKICYNESCAMNLTHLYFCGTHDSFYKDCPFICRHKENIKICREMLKITLIRDCLTSMLYALNKPDLSLYVDEYINKKIVEYKQLLRDYNDVE
jgi:hypothetical protein